MEVLNKITLKTIGMQPKPGSVKENVLLATIYGIAGGYKIGTSNYGEFTKFRGDFEAVTSDGKTFRSGALLLPPTISDMLRVAIDKAGDDAGVQFGVEIGVKHSDVPIGYEYTVHPVFKADAADPLAKLRTDIMARLPAPEKMPEQDKEHTSKNASNKKDK